MKWPWQKPEPVPTVTLPIPNADKPPNWERIVNSDIWQEELYPMYYALRQNALEQLMQAKTEEEFRFLQGKALAIDTLLKTPAQSVAMEKYRQQHEAQEDESGRRRDFGTVERWGRPTRA